MFSFRKRPEMPAPADALPGRPTPVPTAETHFVNGNPLKGPYPPGIETIVLGLGCFWGAERRFWQLPEGVFVTAVGYAGGYTPNPTYEEVCTGQTGHNEVVLVAFDPAVLSREAVLRTFFESHDPTQGMRQGNDTGTQYRSAIYYTTDQMKQAAEATAAAYTQALRTAGHSRAITTEIKPMEAFYFAEEPHQQYLAKNPGGYCGLGGTGVACPAPAPAG